GGGDGQRIVGTSESIEGAPQLRSHRRQVRLRTTVAGRSWCREKIVDVAHKAFERLAPARRIGAEQGGLLCRRDAIGRRPRRIFEGFGVLHIQWATPSALFSPRDGRSKRASPRGEDSRPATAGGGMPALLQDTGAQRQ